MFESLRNRNPTKDKKFNAFIEPKEGWESVRYEIKRAADRRKESFWDLGIEHDVQIGNVGYKISTGMNFCFSAIHPQEDVMNTFAKWTYFALSSDHSGELPQFDFSDVTDKEIIVSKRVGINFIRIYKTTINKEWDLYMHRTWLNSKEHIFGFQIQAKFTEADKL